MTKTGDAFLAFEGVSKKFNRDTVNEVTVFDRYDLVVREGEFVSIVGSNGSGKTTLLNLLCGSLALDGGSIRLRGRALEKLPEHRRAAFIGRVFQDPVKGTCPSLTILENLSLADNKNKPFNLSAGVSRRRLDCYRAQLETLHLGLEDKINLPVGMLSGGQRQALALLISTMTPVELLVLDEHTAALDPKSSENVMSLTEKIVREKGLTALMVTHNLRFAVQYGNRLVMMHQGGNVVDLAEEEKAACAVEDLLCVFNEISIECGN